MILTIQPINRTTAEIIIPIKNVPPKLNEITTKEVKSQSLVRIICDPYFGALGHIVSQPMEPQIIESESTEIGRAHV